MKNPQKWLISPLPIVAVALLVIGCGAYLYTLVSPNQATEQQNTQDANELIAWGSIHSKPLRVIAIPQALRNNEGVIASVVPVGVFQMGEFKNNFLSVVFMRHKGDNSNGIYVYVYFISDKNGNLIAWDPNYMHGLFDGDKEAVYLKSSIGFSEDKKRDLGFLPKELGGSRTKITTNKNEPLESAIKTLIYTDIPPNEIDRRTKNILTSTMPAVGFTEAGWKVVKTTSNSIDKSVLSKYSYFIIMPFGLALSVYPEIPSRIEWDNGLSPDDGKYHQVGIGPDTVADCFTNITQSQIELALIQTGKTSGGDAIYELDVKNYPNVYSCLYKIVNQDTGSFDDFVQHHPVYFWRNPFGDLKFGTSEMLWGYKS